MYFEITFIKTEAKTINTPLEAVKIEESLGTLTLCHESLMTRIVGGTMPDMIVDMRQMSEEEYQQANYHLVW